MKQGLIQALTEFVKNHQVKEAKINVEIISNQEGKKNLVQFMYEQQLRILLRGLFDAKLRHAPEPHITDLKLKILDVLKKNPYVSEDLAEEIKIAFQNIDKKS